MPTATGRGTSSSGVTSSLTAEALDREGLGVEGIVAGHAVVAGRPSLLADWSLELSTELDGLRSRLDAS